MGPESLSLNARCITFGVPNLVASYNSYLQILQTSHHVVILQELIHDARVIPLDGRVRLDGKICQWPGDPRGRWEGDTSSSRRPTTRARRACRARPVTHG